MSKHLDNKVIQACLDREHKPINPHSQRLLTAEARSTGKVPKAAAKKNPKNPKKTPEKIDKSPAVDVENKGDSKKRKTDKQKEAESGVPRTTYSYGQDGIHGSRLVSCSKVVALTHVLFRFAFCSQGLSKISR